MTNEKRRSVYQPRFVRSGAPRSALAEMFASPTAPSDRTGGIPGLFSTLRQMSHPQNDFASAGGSLARRSTVESERSHEEGQAKRFCSKVRDRSSPTLR